MTLTVQTKPLNALSIGLKLPLLLVLIVAATLILTEVSSALLLREAVAEAGERRLEAAATGAAARLERDIHRLRRGAEEMALLPEVVRAVAPGRPGGAEGVADLLGVFAVREGVGILLVDAGGQVVHATGTGEGARRTVGEDGPSGTGIATVVRRVLSGSGFSADAVTGSERIHGTGEARSVFLGHPVRGGEGGGVTGVLVLRLSEADLAGMVTRVGDRWPGVTFQVLDAESGAPGRSGEGLVGEAELPTISHSATVSLRGTGFRVEARAPVEVMTEPLDALRDRMIRDGILVLVLVSVIGTAIARGLTRPLLDVDAALDLVARRDYGQVIPGLGRGDEIGRIARRLDSFRADLVEAERVARENAFKSAAFEGASAALVIVDLETRILYANDAFRALVTAHRTSFSRFLPDISPGSLVGRDLVALDHGIHGALRRMRAAGETRVTREVGFGRAQFRVDVGEVADAEGHLIGYVAEFRDISKLRLQEGVRAALEASYAMAELSADGRFISANPHFLALVGCPGGNVAGLPWRSVMAWRTGAAGVVDPIAALGAADRIEGDVGAPGGAGRTMRATLSAVRDDRGRLEGAVLLADRPAPPETAGAAVLGWREA